MAILCICPYWYSVSAVWPRIEKRVIASLRLSLSICVSVCAGKSRRRAKKGGFLLAAGTIAAAGRGQELL